MYCEVTHANNILMALNNGPLDGEALVNACGLECADPDAEAADAFTSAQNWLEMEGFIAYANGTWQLNEILAPR